MSLDRLLTGVGSVWAGFLRDWDRTLRAGNYPETTRYNYVLAAVQLAKYLAAHQPDEDALTAAEDPARCPVRMWRRFRYGWCRRGRRRQR